MIETLLILGAGLLVMKKPGKPETALIFTQFDPLFKKYAAQFGIDWKMLKAIAMNESGLGVHPKGIEPSVFRGLTNPSDVEGSKSSDGKSWGLMQVTLPTARDYDLKATPEKLNNPEYSIRISAQLVAWLFIQLQNTGERKLEWVIKSYNQGVGNTRKEISGMILPRKKDVQTYWERYQRNFKKLEGST